MNSTYIFILYFIGVGFNKVQNGYIDGHSIESVLYTETLCRWFDSLNVRFVGNWPFGSPFAVTLDTVRHLAFAGSGAGVYVLDISNPASLVKISEKIHTRGTWVRGLFYEQTTQRLYIADGYMWKNDIWDVSDPVNPIKLGEWATRFFAWDIVVQDSFAYVADGGAGLSIINVSNPMNPHDVGVYDTPGYVRGVWVCDTFAYICDDDDGFRVINVANPSNPIEVGFYDTPGYAWEVVIKDSLAYIADADSGLRIIVVSDPTNPHEIGHCNLPGYESCRIAMYDNCAYIANGDSGLRIVDITNPSNPCEIGYYIAPYIHAAAIAVFDSIAYVCDLLAGLRVVDVSIPANVYETTCFNMPSASWSIALSGSCAFITSHLSGVNGELWIADITDPTNPYEIGHSDTLRGTNNLFLVDSLCYLADGAGGLRILNISDPVDPSEIGRCSIPSSTLGVFVTDSIAYIAAWLAGLRIINVANPSNPFEIGYYDTPGYALSTEIIDTLAYVADGSEGLRIINIANLSSPSEVGAYIAPDWVMNAVIVDSFAYLACSNAGLRIVNICDPTTPFEVAYYIFPGPTLANFVDVAGSYAYVAGWAGGLRIINIANSTSPFEVGYFETSDNATAVAVFDHHAYVTDGYNGLQIYEFTPPGVEESNNQTIDTELMILQNPVRGDDIDMIIYLNKDIEATINLYNAFGQSVMNATHKRYTTGKHIIRISAVGLPSGVYFLTYQSKEHTETHKLILLK